MDEKPARFAQLSPKERNDWIGIDFLLRQVEPLQGRGLLSDEAARTIVEEYSTHRDRIERQARFLEAMARLRQLRPNLPLEALGWAERARAIDPEQPEAWVAAVQLLRRMHRFEPASALASEAIARFPGLESQLNPAPSQAPSQSRPAVTERFRPLPANLEAESPGSPGVSWSGVTGEFLKEHWQKLISGLAVLLIVVSSTVGAQVLLGPRLWSPMGKSVLALVFTGLIGGFGLGLIRWGASRAGQMMLVATLIVVAINLMLLGELSLWHRSDISGLILLGVDAACLFAIARRVASDLGLRNGGVFSVFYFGMVAFNVGASPGMPFESGFVVFLAPSVIFLASVAWINARVASKADEADPANVAYLELGVLGFGFLSGAIRTGGLILHLPAALYAVPTMLLGVATVGTSRAVRPIEKDARRPLVLLQGGIILSSLAFALAVARPPGVSSLFSGNTLATAVLGLALYVGLLRSTRKPAYLYCGFASLILAYFGAFYFVIDLVHAFEETARQALGYQTKLPLPFKALNGLIFNVGLALLSRFFARSWDDDRLVRHCHYIGLPLSIAACVFSGFEPKAAMLCMGGYALLYGGGAWFFRQPKLIYLACAASVGSATFGTSMAGALGLAMTAEVSVILGLVFWVVQISPLLRKAGESYRTPLIHAARTMAALAMLIASISVMVSGDISRPALGAFALTSILAVLNGFEAPRVSIFLLAIASFLGVWVGGFRTLSGDGWAFAMTYGAWVATYAVGLLAMGEFLRPRTDRSEVARASMGATIWSVPVVVATAWILASWGFVDGWPVVLALFLGGVCSIWLTRLRREVGLVYVGLASLSASAFSASALLAPWLDRGVGIGWLAATSAACAVLCWNWGEVGRRRGVEPFYVRPCFDMAILLNVAVVGLACLARWESVASYQLGAIGLVVGSVTLALLSASRRWPSMVGASIAWAVGATALVLFSQGVTSPDSAWVVGLVASLEAVACWGFGRVVRWRSKDPASSFAWPLEWACVILLAAGTILGIQSPLTLGVVAITCLLLVEGIPSSDWIYGTFAALGVAIYEKWLMDVSRAWQAVCLVVAAYVSWGLGVVIRRHGSTVRERLGLLELDWHVPMFRSSIILGAMALLFRFTTIARGEGEGWSDWPWLCGGLSVLCLLMLTFDARRGWIHASVGLSGLALVTGVAPWLVGLVWVGPVGMALAFFWLVLSRMASKWEPLIRGRMGWLEGTDFRDIVAAWSLWAFSLVASIAGGFVLVVTLDGYLESSSPIQVAGWFELMITLGLAGLYVAVESRRLGLDVSLIGLELVAVALAWWSGAPGSPLIDRLGISRLAYLPVSTAVLSLVVVAVGLMSGRRSELLTRFTRGLGFGLALIAMAFAIPSGGLVGTTTLFAAVVALGLLALVWKTEESAFLGAMAWCVWSPLAAYQVARILGFEPNPWSVDRPAVAVLVAVVSLWWLAGWLRRTVPETGGRIIRAIEWVAVAAALVPAWLSVAQWGDQGVVGSSVLLALAVFSGWVAARWGAEWPVYVAQALVMVAYFRVRAVLAPSGWLDALLLSLVAYLDLGLAELFQRIRLSLFARPTFRFAMALPLVPLLQSAYVGRGDWIDLYVLLATSSFYALTSVRLRSRTPAYASAVLFNAFLWLAWSQLGWRVADRPQFYLIPVGVTMILFAEVNRRELGLKVVNGLRNFGLVTVYASLASPIWQTQSFGAWLTLLLLSMVGIFLGIGLRIQSFLWLGLACFVADLTYQVGRLGVEHALARWGVMLILGVLLILFVALNEKKQIVLTVRSYYDQARTWE